MATWINGEWGSEKTWSCAFHLCHWYSLPAVSCYYISLISVCMFLCCSKKTSWNDKLMLSLPVIINTTSYKKKRRQSLMWLSALIYGKARIYYFWLAGLEAFLFCFVLPYLALTCTFSSLYALQTGSLLLTLYFIRTRLERCHTHSNSTAVSPASKDGFIQRVVSVCLPIRLY